MLFEKLRRYPIYEKRYQYINELIQKNLQDMDKKKGLEISPLFMPNLIKTDLNNIDYCDYCSTEELKEREKNQPFRIELDLEVQELDFVWKPGKKLQECSNNTYDYIVSCHVLEHVPNFLGYLNQMYDVLNRDGLVVFVLPNKHASSEVFRPESTVGDLLSAYIKNKSMPDIADIYDYYRYSVKSVNFKDLKTIDVYEKDHKVDVAVKDALMSFSEYIDAHCWVFSPESLKYIFHEIQEIGLFNYELLDIIELHHDESTCAQEFVTILKKINTPTKNEVTEIIESFIKYPSNQINDLSNISYKVKIKKLTEDIKHGEQAFKDAVKIQNQQKDYIKILEKEIEDLHQRIDKKVPYSLKERIIHFIQGLLKFNKNSSEMILSGNESAFNLNTSILKISNVEDILNGIQERMQSVENMQHEIINRQYRTPFTINYNDRLLCHTIDGHRVLLDNHDPHISIHVIENGSWENHVRYILSKILFIGDTYVDIGANIGLHALYANSLIGNSGTVYCFEPSKKTFKILKENIELNGFVYSGNNHLYNIAIGESDGLTEFEYFEHHAGMSSIAIDNERVKIFDDTKITEQVEIKKLDTILNSHSINVIKIDVEGFEYSVLKGMINIIENNKSMKVLLEFDPIVNKRILGEKYNDYVVFINKHFQYIYQIKDLSLEQVNPENLTTFTDLLLSNQEVFI